MIYAYKCRECGNIQDEKHGMSEEPVVTCQVCGSTNMFKYLGYNNVRTIFKGGGWAGKEAAFDRINAPRAVRDNAYKRGVVD